jgi:hypothetical protein
VTHPYGDYPASFVIPEHRIWQQLLLKQRVRSAGIAHRFRLEQRFVGAKALDDAGEQYLTGYGYRNRFRYFVKGVIPIRKDGRDSRYFLALYNEVMFNFGRNVQNNIFDQNRAYVARGRKLPWLGNLEVGYLQQTVQQGNGRVFEFNHTLQVGVFSILGLAAIDNPASCGKPGQRRVDQEHAGQLCEAAGKHRADASDHGTDRHIRRRERWYGPGSDDVGDHRRYLPGVQ